MIDYRHVTRVNRGTAVGNPGVDRTGGATGMVIQGRFSGPQLRDVQGRSVSTRTGDGLCSASLSATSPFTKIAVAAAGLSGGDNPINLSTTRIETSADRALSGARAWSPPD